MFFIEIRCRKNYPHRLGFHLINESLEMFSCRRHPGFRLKIPHDRKTNPTAKIWPEIVIPNNWSSTVIGEFSLTNPKFDPMTLLRKKVFQFILKIKVSNLDNIMTLCQFSAHKSFRQTHAEVLIILLQLIFLRRHNFTQSVSNKFSSTNPFDGIQ